MQKRHMLRKINIKGYRSIKEMNLDLNPLNILIGANGSGKSNFLKALGLLKDIAEGKMQLSIARAGKADRLLHFGSKLTWKIGFYLESTADLHYSLSLVTAAGDNLVVGEEIVSLDMPDRGLLLNGNNKESGLKQQSSTIPSAKFFYDSMRRWTIYHFYDTSSSSRLKKAADLTDTDFFKGDGANLAAILFRMRDKYPKHYERILRTVKLALPFLHDFYLQPDRDNAEIILFRWQEAKYTDRIFDADDLSDGSLRFICLTTLLLQPELPPLLLVDEPELGLHPYALTLLAEMLKSASQKTQVIVSTQSPRLLDEFNAEDIIVVNRKEAASTFERLGESALKEWLNDYSLGELWEKNVLGGNPV